MPTKNLFDISDDGALVVCENNTDYGGDGVIEIQTVERRVHDVSHYASAFEFPPRSDHEHPYEGIVDFQHKDIFYPLDYTTLRGTADIREIAQHTCKRVFLVVDLESMQKLGIPTVSYEGDEDVYQPLAPDMKDVLIALFTRYQYEVFLIQNGRKEEVIEESPALIPSQTTAELMQSEPPLPFAKAA